MSHHHDHKHQEDHERHHHEHSHGHGHGGSSLPLTEKAAKLIAHWIHHNQEHGQNYGRWAGEFRAHNLPDAAAALEEAIEYTRKIDLALHKAARGIPSAGK
jgi:hypothetical protein